MTDKWHKIYSILSKYWVKIRKWGNSTMKMTLKLININWHRNDRKMTCTNRRVARDNIWASGEQVGAAGCEQAGGHGQKRAEATQSSSTQKCFQLPFSDAISSGAHDGGGFNQPSSISTNFECLIALALVLLFIYSILIIIYICVNILV